MTINNITLLLPTLLLTSIKTWWSKPITGMLWLNEERVGEDVEIIETS